MGCRIEHSNISGYGAQKERRESFWFGSLLLNVLNKIFKEARIQSQISPGNSSLVLQDLIS